MVPVAPKSIRILSEGEKRVKGFIDKFKVVGLKIVEIAKRIIFVKMIDLTI